MNYFLRFLPDLYGRLLLLQALIIVRPILGGFGFLLIVPLLGFIGLTDQTPPESTAWLLELIPDFESGTAVLLTLLLIMLTLAIVSFSQNLFAEATEHALMLQLRQHLCQMTLNASWQFLAGVHSADFTRMVTDDVESAITALDEVFQTVSTTFLIGVYILICLALSPQLTMLAVATGIVMLLAVMPLQTRVAAAGQNQFNSYEALYRRAQEGIQGIKSIKGNRAESLHQDRFADNISDLRKTSMQYSVATALARLVHSLVAAVAFFVLAWFALAADSLDVTLIILLAVIFSRVLPLVSALQNHMQRLIYIYPEIDRLALYLQAAEKNQEHPGKGKHVDFSKGIRLSGVSCQHPGERTSRLEYSDLNLQPDKIIVIHGPSGIGKTTLVDLIAGILLPTSGKISAGGIALTTATQQDWRQDIAYLPQEPFLIAGSVRSNLNLLVNKPASDLSLLAALELADARFILESPEGLDTLIEPGGSNLSGGERQRLILARALLLDQRVMIFDESTSQLDIQSESAFMQTIRSLRANRTIVVISHRPSIRQYADQLIEIPASAATG